MLIIIIIVVIVIINIFIPFLFFYCCYFWRTHDPALHADSLRRLLKTYLFSEYAQRIRELYCNVM